jgi:hypothetical protein
MSDGIPFAGALSLKSISPQKSAQLTVGQTGREGQSSVDEYRQERLFHPLPSVVDELIFNAISIVFHNYGVFLY